MDGFVQSSLGDVVEHLADFRPLLQEILPSGRGAGGQIIHVAAVQAHQDVLLPHVGDGIHGVEIARPRVSAHRVESEMGTNQAPVFQILCDGGHRHIF